MNIEQQIEEAGNVMRERIISSQLKDLAEASGFDSRGARLQLATNGTNRLTATLGGGKGAVKLFAQKTSFTNEELNELQVAIGASDNHMKIIGHYLRTKCGRQSVSGHREFMSERNHWFDDLFDWKMIPQKAYVTEETLDRNGNTKKKKSVIDVWKPIVFVTDVQELATQIMIKRDYDPDDVVCGLGIDDGGGFLKLMLMIKPKSIPDEEPVRKRRSYEEAFCTTGPARFKAGGQNKILIVSLIPTCERYDNLAPILDLMGIGTLDFGLCADLKLQLIMVGKQNASSKHSCPYCNDASPWLDDNRQSLTIGQLYADYAKFRALVEELGEEKAMKKAKDCNNVIHRPLIEGPYDQKILGDSIMFPELHVFTGLVAKMEKEIEKNLFESEKAGHQFMDEFFSECSISRAVYHGSSNFVGNQAKKLLRMVPQLEHKLMTTLVDPEKLELARKFILALKQFSLVKEACFGQTLDPNYETLIREFTETYRSLPISIPLKLHVLEVHAVEFLKDMGEEHGLGFYSEQSFEAMHNKINENWNKNPLKEDHPQFGPKMKDLVVNVNGKAV